MGEKLAARILAEWPDHDIDVVIPVPDTSRTACLPLAHMLGVKYREGLVKNRYIGRTFIMPGQEERARSVRRKLNVIGLEFKGKNVLLVDDSIVRGTTSRQIVQLARDAGARRVYLASASPPVRHPNVYGIDMPSTSELVAAGRSEEQVREHIGADRLIYQSLADLESAVRGKAPGRLRLLVLFRPVRHRPGGRLSGSPGGAAFRCRPPGPAPRLGTRAGNEPITAA